MKTPLKFEHINYAYNDSHLFFVSSNDNCLYDVDINYKTITLLSILDLGYGSSCTYRSLNKVGDILYIFPFNDNKLIEYCLTGSLKTYKLSNEQNLKITGSFERNGYLYLYGNSPNIYKLNIYNNEKSIIEVEKKAENYFWVDSYIVDNKVILPIADSNCLVSLDENDNISHIVLGDCIEKWDLCNIRILNDKIYVLYKEHFGGFHSSIFNFGGEKISDGSVNFDCFISDIPYTKAFLWDNRWIILPYSANYIGQVDVKGGNVGKCDLAVDSDYKYENRLFNAYAERNGIIYTVDQVSGELLTLDMNSQKILINQLAYGKKVKHYLSNISHGETISLICEREGFISLNDYIEYISDIK